MSQHVKGGWATSLLTDAFLPRILTSFSLRGCRSHGHPAPGSDGIRCAELRSLLFLTHLKNSSRQGAL